MLKLSDLHYVRVFQNSNTPLMQKKTNAAESNLALQNGNEN